ncbi:MAG: mraZ protein [Candidatus Berkelbacteria bacterium Licking1014_2]|uniref:Transcriptional regulator MraZ n=1 Tax=Candidatus Berkelbacteria bacterium Licking1014_2 TaxID=2017146 RepID=A0A554LV52_9BACT|nr:MAG: mraZ protein [Candidatus Berkelbacteria bacterium Licking1014_2]
MFIGEYQHTIDQKNRLAVPIKFREALQDGLIITRGIDECLFIYPKETWQLLAEKIAALPFYQADNRAFSRLMLAGAMEVEIDNQGRILLPGYLKNYGKLKTKIVVAGVYDRLEIWDSRIWQEYKNKTESSAEEIASRVGEMLTG